MKHLLSAVAAVAVLTMTSPAVHAEATKTPAPAKAEEGMKHGDGMMHKGPAKSRQEAIERVKERLKKLESMSDTEWQAKRDAQSQRRQKMKDMTPEERAKLKEQFQGMRDEKAKQ